MRPDNSGQQTYNVDIRCTRAKVLNENLTVSDKYISYFMGRFDQRNNFNINFGMFHLKFCDPFIVVELFVVFMYLSLLD